MNDEKEPVPRRRLVSPNVLFYNALALCAIGLCISSLNAYWTEAIAFVSFAIAFTIVRYRQKGWWRALRSIVFFLLGLTLGVELLTGFVGNSLAFAFISIPLFILSIWLYLEG